MFIIGVFPGLSWILLEGVCTSVIIHLPTGSFWIQSALLGSRCGILEVSLSNSFYYKGGSLNVALIRQLIMCDK